MGARHILTKLLRFAALVGAVVLASPASSAFAASVSPSYVPGNPTCQQLGYDYGFKPGAGLSETTAGTYADPNSGATVTWSYASGTTSVNWSSNIAPEAVVVKAGNGANVYVYGSTTTSDTGLATPANTGGNQATLSHLVFCYNYRASVSKTAATYYTRTYDWTVNKTADRQNLLLANGESAAINYTITVGETHSDSDFSVRGTITILNPWNMPATIVSVTDSLPGATVQCESTTLQPRSSTTCTYTAAVASATNGTNTATAAVDYGMGNRISAGSQPYVFGEPTTTVDATALLTDTRTCPTGFVCTVTAGSVPNQLVVTRAGTYAYTVTVMPTRCGIQGDVVNTAVLVEGDTQTSHAARVTVPATAAGCVMGCTLTQGYWKTHSEYGPAPYDDAWKNLSAAGAGTPFYSSGMSWYQVFQTAPRGNPYYILAHQYMAAKLNVLNGATANPQVAAALKWADMFFATHSPASVLTKTEKTLVQQYAALLDSYNNGRVGPGHCSE